MKKPLPYIIICLLIGLLVIIGLSFNKKESVSPKPETRLEDPTEAHEEDVSQRVASQSVTPEPDPLEGLVPGSSEWWNKGYETPMDFYGLVLDQYDVPVSGAKVVFNWNPRDSDGKISTTTSDVDGHFEFLGRTGISLGVRISKEGYYQIKSEGGSLQRFDFFVPGDTPEHLSDPNNPAVFRLQKKGEGIELINKKLSSEIPSSGNFKVDILTGRLSANGQLELSIERLSQERHFPWKARAVIRGGGFVKAEGQFKHIAPEKGYVEELNWSFPLNDKGRQRNVAFEEYYYVAFDSPRQYGLIKLYLIADSWHLMLESWTNPDGGRNLEPKSQ